MLAFAIEFDLGVEPRISVTSGVLEVNPWLAGLFVLIGFLLLVWWGLLLLRQFMLRTNRVPAALSQKILIVSLPKEKFKTKGSVDKEETPQSLQQEIGVAEGLFSVLGGLRAQRGLKYWLFGRTDQFSAEIVLQHGQIYFYLSIPDYLKDTLEQQIHAAWPFALVEEVEDYNIFLAQGAIAGAYLKFRRDFIFPIKTYRKMDGDPLNSLTNSLSKIMDNGQAAIQIVARSSHKRWHNKGVTVAREMQQGKSLRVALGKAGFGNIFDKFFGFIGAFFKFFIVSKKKNDLNSQTHHLSPLENETVKAIEEKTSKAGLDVNIRVIVSSKNQDLADSSLNNILNAFSQFNVYEFGNSFKKAGFVSKNRLVSDFIHRSFIEKYRLILNAEEMASLWHLPLSTSETPNIHWLEARKSAPPLNMPAEGVLLGQNSFRGVLTPVRIAKDDRQRHMYIIGKSGTGKSVLQANLIIQDIKNGQGVCVIDPHGDLVDAVLEHVPPERAEDVILFDPGDMERPISLNMLEFTNPEQKTFVINEMISIFDKLYDLKATGGPMFEQYMRNAMLLMMEDTESGSTLLEVPKVMADASFRKYKLSKCVNPVVKDFWEKEAEKAGGEAALANMVPYITSKLTPFVSSDLMRPIISQQKSSFNFRELMDGQKVLLIKLAKGKIGDMSANLLGMIVVGKLLMAALSRVDLPSEERKDFYLYIDEFQNFITDSIAIILSEARKYKLCLTIAHQYIGQLVKANDTKIRDAVFGNVGTLVSFRIGPDDAEMVAKQFAPVFNEYDLINVPRYNAYVKLLIDNQNSRAFNFAPYAPAPGDKAMVEKIRQLSRLKYGRDRAEVDKEILARMRLVG
ncbi:MAG: type IV secretion system DNA-binding domain-containing protein [Candidatus Komeilibacteria bacterium]|nr:type IV secretion system DNA-binding domain-containing protein [Candidatus Komeilibacteria bacterium]